MKPKSRLVAVEKKSVGARPKPKLIAICGKKGVGKNFVAKIMAEDYLSREAPGLFGVTEIAFAEPFKEFLVNILGVDRSLVYGDDKKKNKKTRYSWGRLPSEVRKVFPGRSGRMTVRELMQVFGTNIMRKMFDDEVWVKAFVRKATEEMSGSVGLPMNVIVTDLRFKNEARAIRRLGGKIVRVVGDQRGGKKAAEDKHVTETEMDNYKRIDYVVRNPLGATRDDISEQVSRILL